MKDHASKSIAIDLKDDVLFIGHSIRYIETTKSVNADGKTLGTKHKSYPALTLKDLENWLLIRREIKITNNHVDWLETLKDGHPNFCGCLEDYTKLMMVEKLIQRELNQ